MQLFLNKGDNVMYFNRKNAEQKNWRMIKKGKHFLFLPFVKYIKVFDEK